MENLLSELNLRYGVEEDMETSSKGSETDDEEVSLQEEDEENELTPKRRLLEKDVGNCEQGGSGSDESACH